MKNIKFILTSAVLALLASCANDDNYGTPSLSVGCQELTATKQVSEIAGMANNTIQQFAESGVIEAFVTSSDEGGNFYKTISFVSLDNATGFSIPVDDYNLYTKYPPGQKVYIKLDSLYFQNRTSQTRGLQIGANYSNNVGRIAPISYRNIIIPACEGSVKEDSLVYKLQINQAKNDNYLNKLIEFEDVQFSETSLGHNYFAPELNSTGNATNHMLEDNAGNSIIVRVSQYSTFAYNPVATGGGKIRGVLTKYGSDYQFMVRTESDIDMDGDRLSAPEPGLPGDPANLLFTGSDFENWTGFLSALNQYGLQSYAVQGNGMGVNGGASLHLNGTPSANDYVFTATAASHGNLPANPTKITFWVKGTSSAKSISLNVYRSTSGYDVFNVGNLGTNAVTLSKANLNSSNNGTNSYTGTIDTNGQWVKITLDISDVNLNMSTTGDLFALKVGSASLYNLHIDNIEIE